MLTAVERHVVKVLYERHKLASFTSTQMEAFDSLTLEIPERPHAFSPVLEAANLRSSPIESRRDLAGPDSREGPGRRPA